MRLLAATRRRDAGNLMAPELGVEYKQVALPGKEVGYELGAEHQQPPLTFSAH